MAIFEITTLLRKTFDNPKHYKLLYANIGSEEISGYIEGGLGERPVDIVLSVGHGDKVLDSGDVAVDVKDEDKVVLGEGLGVALAGEAETVSMRIMNDCSLTEFRSKFSFKSTIFKETIYCPIIRQQLTCQSLRSHPS